MVNLTIAVLAVCLLEVAAGIWLILSTRKFTRRINSRGSAPRISRAVNEKLKLAKDQRI